MKKYIRPTAEVVELSIRESLSALPGNMDIKSVTAKNAATTQLITTYALRSSDKDFEGNPINS